MSFATLINQMHVVLIPSTATAVVLIWYRRRPEIPMCRLLLGLASFGAFSALVIGVTYFGVAIFVVGITDLHSIIEWSKGYASKVLTTPFSIVDPIKSFIGIGRAVLGGHFLSGFDWFHGPFTRLYPRKLMVEERYRVSLSAGVRITCLVATVVAALSGIYIAVSLVPPPSRAVSEQREEVQRRRLFAVDAFAAINLITSYAFNVVWEIHERRVWDLLPTNRLHRGCLAVRPPAAGEPQAGRGDPAASLFIANGLGSIWPQTKLESDYWYQANRYLI